MTPEERGKEIAEKWIVGDDLRDHIAAAIRAAVAEERERIAKLAEELEATYTTTEKGWGLGGQDGTICSEHCFAARIRALDVAVGGEGEKP